MNKVWIGLFSIVAIVIVGILLVSEKKEPDQVSQPVETSNKSVGSKETSSNKGEDSRQPNTPTNTSTGLKDGGHTPEPDKTEEPKDEKTPESNKEEVKEEVNKKEFVFKKLEPIPLKKERNIEKLNLISSLTIKNKSVQFQVENKEDRVVTLQFMTSQYYDYEIYSKSGEFIYRYSDGKSFLQVLKDVPLAPNESVSYDISLPELEKGEYTLVVRLTARDMQYLQVEKEFTAE
ncbi:BsuPI-related putative proteinase inhibitor [Bacillus sp. FJAT-45066]|uniref:BsuPI-related putative proteinase inhibitor n=1 Tax=Bacillus sp. FJAT-45066 TaxID=2011010 RepID=UPI001597048E|nr:BsuPI-related putative proteinase inhibitor [Bacillus sp. FJAT-45066]